jgi:23S rRNA pseudouridine1911/1915/1917 synthase
MKEVFHFRVSPEDNRSRFDEFLFARFGMFSKMHLRNLLKAGAGTVNGIPEQPGFHLKTDDAIEISVDLSANSSMKPDYIPLEILFEDDEIVVVNKPPEILIHPTKGVKSGTLLNALSFHLNQKIFDALGKDSEKKEREGIDELQAGIIRPGLVHRLDKQTSGLLVIAKTKKAHKFLAEHFRRKLVEKKYFALVEGVVEPESGTIDAPVGYNEALKIWEVQKNGKAAETRFLVLEKRENSTLLELEPVTGRTNQLRIHCAYSGHPIIGDTERGGREFSRLCLHAYKLSFRHPGGNERIEIKTKMPEEFRIIDAQISKG